MMIMKPIGAICALVVLLSGCGIDSSPTVTGGPSPTGVVLIPATTTPTPGPTPTVAENGSGPGSSDTEPAATPTSEPASPGTTGTEFDDSLSARAFLRQSALDVLLGPDENTTEDVSMMAPASECYADEFAEVLTPPRQIEVANALSAVEHWQGFPTGLLTDSESEALAVNSLACVDDDLIAAFMGFFISADGIEPEGVPQCTESMIGDPTFLRQILRSSLFNAPRDELASVVSVIDKCRDSFLIPLMVGEMTATGEIARSTAECVTPRFLDAVREMLMAEAAKPDPRSIDGLGELAIFESDPDMMSIFLECMVAGASTLYSDPPLLTANDPPLLATA